MTDFEKTVLAELKDLKTLTLKDQDWVSKELFMSLTGFKSATVNSMVARGKLVKKGPLYSWRAYKESLGIYGRRRRLK